MVVLPILSGKIYAIYDLKLISKSLSSRLMSFEPLLIDPGRRLLGLGQNTMRAIHSGMFSGLIHATRPALAGKPLIRLNTVALYALTSYLEEEIPETETVHVSDLYNWLGTALILSSARALYGSQSPLSKERSLVDDLRSFETGSQLLLANIMPWITAYKAYNARERLISALTPLFEASRVDSIEEISRIRARVHREYGNTDAADIARCEVAMLHVATVNTAPLLFWAVADVFTRPDLLVTLREECRAVADVSLKESPEGLRQVTVSISKIERECPLLLACYREVCRLRGQPLLMREVSDDVSLPSSDDGVTEPHLIEAKSQVMIAAGITHQMTDIWGDDTAEFRPERFLD
ncbi:hypothetical protein PspLS_08176 [Pyricularia sp. CBS 133598]|nr:hypothetical protein PspLS_08176 [Pyricularia sp. CBS 133598]